MGSEVRAMELMDNSILLARSFYIHAGEIHDGFKKT